MTMGSGDQKSHGNRVHSDEAKGWTDRDVQKLRDLARQGLSTRDIAQQLGRTEKSIYSKASDEGISLLPGDSRESYSGRERSGGN
jgi:hypothetical protein